MGATDKILLRCHLCKAVISASLSVRWREEARSNEFSDTLSRLVLSGTPTVSTILCLFYVNSFHLVPVSLRTFALNHCHIDLVAFAVFYTALVSFDEIGDAKSTVKWRGHHRSPPENLLLNMRAFHICFRTWEVPFNALNGVKIVDKIMQSRICFPLVCAARCQCGIINLKLLTISLDVTHDNLRKNYVWNGYQVHRHSLKLLGYWVLDIWKSTVTIVLDVTLMIATRMAIIWASNQWW